MSAVLLLVTVVFFLSSSIVLAQGTGVRSSSVKFHPSAKVGIGYDSNFWRESANEATAPLNPVFMSKYGLGLKADNRKPGKLGVKFNADVTGRTIVALSDVSTTSDQDNASAVDTANLKLKLNILPKAKVGFELHAKGRYTDRPASENLKEDGYQRLNSEFGPTLRISPGGRPGSRALDLKLGYRFHLVYGLNENPSLGSKRGDKQTHKFNFETKWKFYPKTALLMNVSYWKIDYGQRADFYEDDFGSPTLVNGPNKDYSPLRAEIGLKGLITNRLALTLKVGYINSFHPDAAPLEGDMCNAISDCPSGRVCQDQVCVLRVEIPTSEQGYEGPIASFELDYYNKPKVRVRLGYRLKIGDDSFSNYYRLQQAYLKLKVKLSRRVTINGGGGFDYYEYSSEGTPIWAKEILQEILFQTQRTEPVIRGQAGLTVQPKKWLKIKAEYNLENNRSDFFYCLGERLSGCTRMDNGENPPLELASYVRHVANVSLIAEY